MILVALRSLGLGACSGVGIKGLFGRRSGESLLWIFMVLERFGLCCSALVIVVSVGLRCNGADDAVDWTGKREELLSIEPNLPALALGERPDVLGSCQNLSFPLCRQASVDGINRARTDEPVHTWEPARAGLTSSQVHD